MQESFLTIGNRYANSIKEEIALLPDRIAGMDKSETMGFIFHNLACLCERIEKYYGMQLRSLGYSYLMDKIKDLGANARKCQKRVEEVQKQKKAQGLSTTINDAILINDAIHLALITNREAQSLVPILFFI